MLFFLLILRVVFSITGEYVLLLEAALVEVVNFLIRFTQLIWVRQSEIQLFNSLFVSCPNNGPVHDSACDSSLLRYIDQVNFSALLSVRGFADWAVVGHVLIVKIDRVREPLQNQKP